MKSVLLADDNKNWLDILDTAISQEENLTVIGKVYNGRDVIDAIHEFHPDIIILDIIMPEFDGVYIIEYIRKFMTDYQPIIYVLSGIGTDSVIKIISDLDVAFYSLKPVTVSLVMKNLQKILNHSKAEEPHADSATDQKEIIKALFYSLGIKPHLFSTKCMTEAILCYLNDTECRQMLTKVLYPQVARSFNTSSSSVEKNLRMVVSQMKQANTETFNQLFLYSQSRKISNGEFLSVIAAYIEKSNVQ